MPTYTDQTAPVETRISSLLAAMTLDEKLLALGSDPNVPRPESSRNLAGIFIGAGRSEAVDPTARSRGLAACQPVDPSGRPMVPSSRCSSRRRTSASRGVFEALLEPSRREGQHSLRCQDQIPTVISNSAGSMADIVQIPNVFDLFRNSCEESAFGTLE